MNMKQEIQQLRVAQNIQNVKHQIEMNQLKKICLTKNISII